MRGRLHLLKRRVKLVLARALRTKCSVHCIALSAALGVGFAIGVPLGLQTAVALLSCWLLKLNVPTVLLGTMFANPVTIVPMYGLIVWLGTTLTGISFGLERFTQVFASPTPANFLALGSDGLAVFFAGALPLAILCGAVVYICTRNIVNLYVHRFAQRRERLKVLKNEKKANSVLTTEPPIH